MLWIDTGETRRGVPIWKAACKGKCRLSSAKEPACDCWCKKHAAPASMPCVHRGQEVARHGCCGAPTIRVYACDERTACVLKAADADTLEWEGQPVAACEGCDQRSTASPV